MSNEPREIKINPWTILFMSFAFALVFFIIGAIFRHYVWISA